MIFTAEMAEDARKEGEGSLLCDKILASWNRNRMGQAIGDFCQARQFVR